MSATPEYDRVPPQDVPAEQAVLGAMLISSPAIADVVEELRPGDFYRPAHQIIYEAAVDLYGRGEPVDQITVAAELTRLGELQRVGGAPYLIELAGFVPTAASAGYYARIVADKAVARRLVEAATRILQRAYGETGDARELVDYAQQAVYDVTGRRTGEDTVRLEDLLQPTLDEIEAMGTRDHDGTAGVPTGFADLDALTNGLHPGQLVIVAARPSIGKSTVGLDVARSASIRRELPSVVFSLEMAKNEIVMRMLSAEARVNLSTLRSGRLTDDDWSRLARRMGEVANAPLYIDDSPNLSMTEIRAKARRLKQRIGLRLIVVDYIQLMTAPGSKSENRQQEVSAISRSLKLLAKELDVPVVAISQLNRSSEQRADKKPMLSDLRESGSLEQDADMVILIYREDAYEQNGPRAGEADFIVAKHRNGPVGTVTVAFQGHYSRFMDMKPAGT